MHLKPEDAHALDILLEHLQNSAIRDGKDTIAETFRMMREHLPKQGGVPDEKLVMDIQTILIPLLESNDPAGPPETLKARIREIFTFMDRGRSSQ